MGSRGMDTVGALRLLLACAAVLGASCGGSLGRFPMRETVWEDADRGTFGPRPPEYFSPFGWDAADHTIFRPMSRFFAVDPGGEAVNVNALDEVPSSSWFQNRIGLHGMTPAEVERGACTDPVLAPVGTWTVKGAKPNGANPGFIIKAGDGRRYLLKFDGTLQGERATTADILGSRLYHAAGYWSPCNSAVFFTRDLLVIDPEAESENETGEKVPLTWDDIDKVLAKAYVLPDGRFRASASLFLPGMPIGPWTYQDTREDDPNDVIDHQDRRELRGGYVLASWINHFDAREQNSLAIWMDSGEDGRGYVRHYYLDFGDCLGSLWDFEGISRRLGHAYYLDIPYLVEDALTFGVLSHPWQEPQFGPTGPVLGYFQVESFVPDEWRPGYPNPAFIRATERDNAWMARIIAEISEAHLAAALAPARTHDALTRSEIMRILMGRREKLLRRWFSKLSPLTHPRVEADEQGAARLCMRDMAVRGGVTPAEGRRYRASAWAGPDLAPLPAGPASPELGDRACVALPAVPGASSGAPGYLVVDVIAESDPDPRTGPARVHLYHRGGADYMVVGLERPELEPGAPEI